MQPFLILDTPNSPERRGHRAILADHRQHSELEVQRYCDAVQQGLPKPPHLHVTRKVTQRLHDRDRVDMPEHLILAGISPASLANKAEVEAALQKLLASWDPTVLNSVNDRDDLYESHPTVATWETEVLSLILRQSPAAAASALATSAKATPEIERSKGFGAGLVRLACIVAVAGIVIACGPKLQSLMSGLSGGGGQGTTGVTKQGLLVQALQVQLPPNSNFEKDLMDEMKGKPEDVDKIFSIFDAELSATSPQEPQPEKREKLWKAMLPPRTAQLSVEWAMHDSINAYKRAAQVTTDREMCKKLQDIVNAVCAKGAYAALKQDGATGVEQAAIDELGKIREQTYQINLITLRDLDRWYAVEKFFGPESRFLTEWKSKHNDEEHAKGQEDWKTWEGRVEMLKEIKKRDFITDSGGGAPWRKAILKAVANLSEDDMKKVE